MVTGKGGVGKSTFVACLALLSARRGDKTLVCELNTHEQVSRLLGHSPAGSELRKLEDNLWAVNIEPERALEEYGLMKLRFQSFFRLVFKNPLVSALVRFIPGLNDLLMLGKAFNHEREKDDDGHPVWDRIIIDAPATGHSLTFFRLPKVISKAVPSGNMHEESVEMWRLLTDQNRTGVHLVALPEELPVQETIELHERLTAELELPVSSIVVNQMPQHSKMISDHTLMKAWTKEPVCQEMKALWQASQVRESLVQQASMHRKHLNDLAPLIELPVRYSEHFGRSDIEALANKILESCHE